MKSAVFLLVVGLCRLQVAKCKPTDDMGASKAKLGESAMLIVDDCKVRTGAVDADVDVLRSHRLPTSKSGLCLLQCLLTAGGIMRDGRLHTAGAIEFFTPSMHGDLVRLEKLRAMVEHCEEATRDADVVDGCKNARRIVDCTVTNGRDFGFTFPNHLQI